MKDPTPKQKKIKNAYVLLLSFIVKKDKRWISFVLSKIKTKEAGMSINFFTSEARLTSEAIILVHIVAFIN